MISHQKSKLLIVMKYPIGIQTFSEIIEEGYVYVDKTAMVYRLANSGKSFFLSRPRRFGKSLLLSTLEAYFLGRSELFGGLALEKLETAWNKYPVLRLDLNNGNYRESSIGLMDLLNSQMLEWEKQYQIEQQAQQPGPRFRHILKSIHTLTGKRVVVLIDEYDKPIISNVEHGKADLQEEMRAILKGFYGTLKSCDEHIRFAMLTGVSRFSKMSVFSDLNNLIDISMRDDYSEICGISERELHHYFDTDVQRLADKYSMSKQKAYDELQRMYDGYRFSEMGEQLYNPWSIFNSLDELKFGISWSLGGTPTFLIKMLRDRQLDLTVLDHHIVATEKDLSTLDNNDNTIAALYQTGYLTIKDFDTHRRRFILGIPNEEVSETLTADILPVYTRIHTDEVTAIADRIYTSAQNGDVDGMMEILKGIIASAPMESGDERVLELNYRNLIAVAFKISGLAMHIEQPTCKGRIDLALETVKRVYIFEFKRSTLAAAERQMESRRYAEAYAADSRPTVLVAVRLDDAIRNIADWAVVER